MTIHSGFATRQQETNYNKCVEALVVVLFKRVVKVYTKEECEEEQFKQYLIKILSCMHELEAHKYAPPKYSKRSDFLCQILQIDYKSSFKLCTQGSLQRKSSNFTNANQVKRNYYRIYNCQKALNKTAVAYDKDPQSQVNAIFCQDNQKNQVATLCSENNSTVVCNQNSRQLKQHNKRGNSSNCQYKDKFIEQTRPKSSSTQSHLLKNQESKGIKVNIEHKENFQEKEKKYQDYLEKYNENYFKNIDQSSLEKSLLIQNQSNTYKKEHQQITNELRQDDDQDTLTQIGCQNPIEMDYSDDSVNMRGVPREDCTLQEEESLIKNIEDIQNEQQISFQSPFSFSPEKQYLKQKSFDQSKKDERELNETKQSRRYTKSKSALAYSLGINQSNINNESLSIQKESLIVSNIIFKKSDLNAKMSTKDENQSFAFEKISKQKSSKSSDDNFGHGTAYFKEQHEQTSSSKLNQSKKNLQTNENGSKSQSSQQTNREQSSLLNNGDNQIENEGSQLDQKNNHDDQNRFPSTILNVVIPGKKITKQEIFEQFIKSSSPQFCQNQIDAIKQQLNMQTTYLQIQQQQLDKKMQQQQQELQQQLQSNQINQQKLIKAEQNNNFVGSISDSSKENNCIQDMQDESQNQKHIEEIQEEQEEEEESVFKGSPQKKHNKIQQIQLRQLRKERQIQNCKNNDKQDQNLAEDEVEYKFEDISSNNQTLKQKNTTSNHFQKALNSQIQQEKTFNKEVASSQGINTQLQQEMCNTNNDQKNFNKAHEDTTKTQIKQIKRRVKILPCTQNNEQKQDDQKQKMLSDISNIQQNKLNEQAHCKVFQRCKTELQHERLTIDQKKQDQKDFNIQRVHKTIDYENDKKFNNSKIPTRFCNQIGKQSVKEDQEIADRKNSIEPTIPSIEYQNLRMTSNGPGQRNLVVQSAQSRSRHTQQMNISQSPTFHHQSKENNENSNSFQQKTQFKISRGRELSQSFRDQYGESIKELSTEIYINSVNSKKNEFLTPFWGEENKQNIKQTFSKQDIQSKQTNQMKQNKLSSNQTKENAQNNENYLEREKKQTQEFNVCKENNQKVYSFYPSQQENSQISDQINKDITLSNILNGPYNPQHLNQLQKEPKDKKESTKSPKTKVRSYTSHSFNQNNNYNYKQSNENSNALIFTQMPARVYYLPSNSNSPISTISATSNSTNKKQLNFKNKQLERDSYFRF
ncbi:hypothetical protein ABPG72_021830 [Tetrahymena utriculariae]